MISSALWTLIAIQVAMGAFDTLYHHELTERLPWRTSQQHELKLHAVRNLLYVALFLALGFLELHGIWALLVIAVLGIEVVITLMDFVEEDLSRKLPASERINHTLLALNYGAILALLLPVLIEWAGQPAAIVPVFYGYWSFLAALAALGVLLFGLRDMAASRRAPTACLRRCCCAHDGTARPAARADHWRDRIHRQSAGGRPGGCRASRDRARPQSRQSRCPAGAISLGDEPRSNRKRHAYRRHYQLGRRAAGKRIVDAREALSHRRLPAADWRARYCG